MLRLWQQTFDLFLMILYPHKVYLLFRKNLFASLGCTHQGIPAGVEILALSVSLWPFPPLSLFSKSGFESCLLDRLLRRLMIVCFWLILIALLISRLWPWGYYLLFFFYWCLLFETLFSVDLPLLSKPLFWLNFVEEVGGLLDLFSPLVFPPPNRSVENSPAFVCALPLWFIFRLEGAAAQLLLLLVLLSESSKILTTRELLSQNLKWITIELLPPQFRKKKIYSLTVTSHRPFVCVCMMCRYICL